MASTTIIVRDYRPELSRVRHVAEFPNTPDDWTAADILKRYGIAEHLHVVATGYGRERVIQRGRGAP